MCAVKLTTTEQRAPRRLQDLGMRRHNAQNAALVQHRGDLARLHRHQIAADAVDDGLEDDEALEIVDGLVEHQTAQAADEQRTEHRHPAGLEHRPRVFVEEHAHHPERQDEKVAGDDDPRDPVVDNWGEEGYRGKLVDSFFRR